MTLTQALSKATDTRQIELRDGALSACKAVFTTQFPGHKPLIVADANTFTAAGKTVSEILSCPTPFIFTDPNLYAEHHYVEQLEAVLKTTDAIPVAVGSGVINDLVKLSAHRTGRQYLAVATAASMDGYTAFGSSITFRGSKQTFTCPAPRAVIADLNVIRNAPRELNASGYADLLAKITAGADWILADALGIEPIDSTAWDLVQTPLRASLANPSNVDSMMQGLLLSGLAMQWTKSSRCASGAEHQFSHLWDMQRESHDRSTPSHGFQVGVATAAVGGLYEKLLARPLENLDVDACVSHWPDWSTVESNIRKLFTVEALLQKALEESKAKYIPRPEVSAQLHGLKKTWPNLKQRLTDQLLPGHQIQSMLRQAGAPAAPEQIGISPDELNQSFLRAYHIRRRYTVLDLAVQIRAIN